MKKTSKKKLTLNKESMRRLQDKALEGVAGGGVPITEETRCIGCLSWNLVTGCFTAGCEY
jgi:hypothetical protein